MRERDSEVLADVARGLGQHDLGFRILRLSDGIYLDLLGGGDDPPTQPVESLLAVLFDLERAGRQETASAIFRDWNTAERAYTRYVERSGSQFTAERQTVGALDRLSLLGTMPMVLEILPARRRTDSARLSLGMVDPSSPSPAWSWSLVLFSGLDPIPGDRISAALFGATLPIRSEQRTYPAGEAWISSIIRGERGPRHGPPSLAARDAMSALILAHPGETVNRSFRTRPLSVSRSGPSQHLSDILTFEACFRHVAFTGDPGTGKSAAVQGWLADLGAGIPGPIVTAIDPVKRLEEYGSLLDRDAYTVVGTDAILPLNPLVPPADMPVSAWSEYVVRAIDQVTHLSEGFPLGVSILRNGVASAYEIAAPRWPSMSDVVRHVSGRLGGILSGSTTRTDDVQLAVFSLRERLASISDAQGQGALCGDSDAGLPWDALRSEPSIILLQGIQSLEQRRIVSLLLLAGVCGVQTFADQPAERIVLLEEAHLFVDASPVASETDLLSELLGRAVAEQRSRRLGFVFVEQRPSSLPQAILANVGSTVAFRNSDGVEADRIAKKLNLGSAGEATITELPDYTAIVRVAGAPSGVLHRFEAIDAPSTPVGPGVPDQSVRRRFVLPWCEHCPYPCVGSYVLNRHERIDAASDERMAPRRAARAAIDEAALTVGELLEIGPLDAEGEMTKRQVAGVYCRAANRVASADHMSAEQRRLAMRLIGDWTRSGQLPA